MDHEVKLQGYKGATYIIKLSGIQQNRTDNIELNCTGKCCFVKLFYICVYVYMLGHNVKYIVLCLIAQSCPTLCDPMNCIAHQAPLSVGILQARILEWVAMPSSRRSSLPSDGGQVSRFAGGFLTI